MADVRFNFKDNRVEVLRAIDDAVGAFLLEASAELVSQVARNTRVKSGQTKGSWQAVVDENERIATVGSPLENAIWEEFGTGEYAVNGDGRKGGWIYEDVYGNHYFTRGKKPTHALQKAFDSRKNAIKRRAKQEFGARLK